MKNDLSSSKRLAPLLSLLVLFVTLLLLTLFLSQQVLLDISHGAAGFDTAVIYLVLGLPLTLLGAVIYQAAQLWREKSKNRPGTRLKIRLSLFFLLVVLMASIPQGILSLSFIDTTMKSWLGSRVGEALKGGLNTALEFHQARIVELKNAATSPSLPEITRQALAAHDPELLNTKLEEANLRPSSFQLFDAYGRVVLKTGDAQGFLPEGAPVPLVDGPLPKETTSQFSILRQVRHLGVDRRSYTAVLSLVLPKSFDETSQSLTEALNSYKQFQQYNETFRTMIYFFYFIFALPILLTTLLISFSLSDDLIRPLINLEKATRRVAEGDFSTRILTPERDELSFLAESFNAMTSELQVSRTQLLQTEKVTAWQEIARQLAHELRNPLTPIKLSAERLLRRAQYAPEKLDEIVEPAVQAIVAEVNRLDSMLKEFSDFARLPSPQKRQILLKPILDSIVGLYSQAHPMIVFHNEGVKEDIQLLADPGQMEQVFTNLIKNAVEAMGGVGEIFLRTSLVKKGNASYCRIQIHDTGPGINPDVREKVFNPYYTTKKDGTGLGLAIVERLVFDHQGSVWFESQENFGSTFFIDLPAEAVD